MKNNNIFVGMLLASVTMLSGCSSDYLNVAPESEPSTGSIAKSLAAAKLAMRGIGRAMNCQYSKVTTGNQFNGEAYVNTIYNDGWGQDYYGSLGMQQFGASLYNWNEMGNERQTWCVDIPWNYGYQLVYICNGVLDGLAANSDTENPEYKFIRAQALTCRAHGYVKLLQFYAPRWEDSNNGETPCLVLRLSQNLGDSPLVSMKAVKEQLYADLNEAIQLFDESKKSREYKWEANKEVAEGIYARLAMICHDWKKAKEMAHAAQDGYQIMDNNTAFAGFYADNNDYMWCSSAEPSDIYYWSWGCHYTGNGHYSKVWGIGAGAISLDLYNQLDPNDIRRNWFLTPDKVANADKKLNPGGLKPEDFWSSAVVDATSMNMNLGNTFKKKGDDNPWGMKNFVALWGIYYRDNIFKGNLNEVIVDDAETNDPAYFCFIQEKKQEKKPDGEGWFALAKGHYAMVYPAQIGAEYKFWSLPPYGVSHYPYMRSTEMLLTEAEAAFMDGDETTAKNCLSKLQSMRISGYKGAGSGQALLDEIRLARRIELWGEGMSWSDLKRWNLPCVRRAWVDKDPTSGNIAASYAMTRQPNEQAGWRFMVPAKETDFNKAIDKNLLPQPGEYTSAKK